MNKILLTGSTGFIGSQLLKNFTLNNKVYVIIRKKNYNSKNKNIINIPFKDFDKLNKDLKKIKVDTVIHCATHYVKNHQYNDLKKLSESNILLGNIILENLQKMNVKKFINFSTVWTHYDGKEGNFFNLYSVYKQNFNNIINYYSKSLKKIKFFNLVISDTFGKGDKRKKLINILKKNYKKNRSTSIISKNLSMNLLNVSDIVLAVDQILRKNIKSGTYLLKNKKNFSVSKIIQKINRNLDKNIKIKWLSYKKIDEKLYNFNQLREWQPINSNIQDIINIIKK